MIIVTLKELVDMEVPGNSIISNAKVYGIEDSFRASKYPMAVDISKCTDEVTPTIKRLFTCDMGTGHDNALKGCIVQFDMTFTPKMSVELERYHFIDFVSSQSTMHRITKFDLDKSYIKYVDKRIIDIMKEKIEEYNKTKDENLYLEILYSNPCGFLLTARLTTNYQQLKTIYSQRRFHRLPEWRLFCEFCETLPYFNELVLGLE